MWGLGIGIIIVFIILNVMAGDNEVMNVLVSILSLGVGIVLGMQGNKLREGNLKKRGYQEVPQVIQAGNPGSRRCTIYFRIRKELNQGHFEAKRSFESESGF